MRTSHSVGTLIFLIGFFATALARAETNDIVELNTPESPQAYQPPSPTKWILFSAAEVATIALVSQTENGPLIFGGIYAVGSLFLMREIFVEPKDSNYVLPFGMLAMSVLNFALLNNNSQFSYGSVFSYNLVGAGLLTAYAWWNDWHRNGRHRSYALTPMLGAGVTGVACNFNY